MIKINELVLGDVDKKIRHYSSHVFIVTREKDELVYHAKYVRNHCNIMADDFPKADILGGGFTGTYPTNPNELCLEERSGEFGPLPNELLAMYSSLLLEFYRQEQPLLESVAVNLAGNEQLDDWLNKKNLILHL